MRTAHTTCIESFKDNCIYDLNPAAFKDEDTRIEKMEGMGMLKEIIIKKPHQVKNIKN